MRITRVLLFTGLLSMTGCGLNDVMAYQSVDWLTRCDRDEFTATNSCFVTSQSTLMRYPQPSAFTVALNKTSDGENVMLTITNNSNGYFNNDMLQARVGPNEIIDLHEGNQLFSNRERGLLIVVPSKETGDLLLEQMRDGSEVMFRATHMLQGVLTMPLGLKGFNEAWMALQ